MIADITTASFSSLSRDETLDPDAGGSGATAGELPFGARSEGYARGEVRPMGWLVPWLWQLSQSRVPEGEAMEWEMDLPEGDHLKLVALRQGGEWTLDFSGSSRRLQRWLGQHREELCSRLERIIGQAIEVRTESFSSLSKAS